MSKPLMRLENIDVAFGNTLAVKNATLEIRQNEILALMGLSGSGKSTLLRVMNGLASPTKGEIHWYSSREFKTLRDFRLKNMAMVFQQFAIFPWRSVLGNTIFGLEIQGVPLAECVQRAELVLQKVGLYDWRHQFPSQLSGGMQQRVGIARALATDAELLLMDEPFSALDPLIRYKLQEELLSLQQEFKKTIVFVTHDLDEAFFVGNRIAIMKAGQIVQVDTPQKLMTSPADDYVAELLSKAHLCSGCRKSPIAEQSEA